MAPRELVVIGWDIGGVNTKAVRLHWQDGNVLSQRAATRPFEIWREKKRLLAVLQEIAAELVAEEAEAMAVTMTAELSDVFRSKREGVLFVFDQLSTAFPHVPVYALALDGAFVPLNVARLRPLDFAAANWLAGALFVARQHPDCILVDVGSTTTDVIPIRNGQATTEGRTDLSRLAAGELVYTGVLRTNPNAIVSQVPVQGRLCRVSAEYFTVMGDVYLLLGYLPAASYTIPTPDGREKTPQRAHERLARLVCADGEMLSREQVLELARYLHEKQLQQISDAVLQVLSRLEGDYRPPLAVAGAGRFLASEVGHRLGLPVIDLEKEWGSEVAAVIPCLAAAYLLAGHLDAEGR